MMLDEVCREIKNYFVVSPKGIIIDNYAITNGVITPFVDIQTGQYYRVVGSVFNDGVYTKGQETLQDEPVFHGAIWLMRPPKAFLALVEEIAEWQAKYGSATSVAMSPYTSESFGGYSYSKDTSGDNSNGQSGLTWQNIFATRLGAFRRLVL